MVRTRRSKEIEEEQVHDDSGNAQASSGSDSDDAPEEVSLAHSKTVRYYMCHVLFHTVMCDDVVFFSLWETCRMLYVKGNKSD